MKTLSMAVFFSLVSSVSFAKRITNSNTIEKVACVSIFEQRASEKVTSAKDASGNTVVAISFQDNLKQNRLAIFSVKSVQRETDSFRLELSGHSNDAVLETDMTGSSLLVVNGIAQDLLNLQCEISLSK